MAKSDSYNPLLIGPSKDRAASVYGRAGKRPSHNLVVGPESQVIRERSFKLAVKRQKQTLDIDNTSGWILRNKFFTRTEVKNYGIVSRLFFTGIARYKRPGRIFQVREETIECETIEQDTLFDVYLSWDGMIGTQSQNGLVAYNMGISVAFQDELKMLSQSDRIEGLGAKDCRGRSQLPNNRVLGRGNRVTFVIHYEMSLSVDPPERSLSEIHFEDPVNNFFKIVTH